jgi:uncharacterized protein (DUF488 family)
VLAGIGYEGRTAEEVVALLREADIDVAIDVRLTPSSRVVGLSKNKLAARLDGAGIDYVHEPDLGNPKDNRSGFHSAHPEEARARYQARLDTVGREAVQRVAVAASTQRVALLCFERDRGRCHRDLVLAAVAAAHPDLVILDL